VKDLLLRVLDPCFIGLNLLLHLDVHQMVCIKITLGHSTIPEDGVL
jgi:hypothetical protein